MHPENCLKEDKSIFVSLEIYTFLVAKIFEKCQVWNPKESLFN